MSSDEDPELYDVHFVSEASWDADARQWLYRVRWYGYGPQDDTEEPESSLIDQCDDLLARFWKNVGGEQMRNAKNKTKTHYVASSRWIEKEAADFEKKFNGPPEPRSSGSDSSSSEDEDEEPKRMSLPKSGGPSQDKGKRREDMKQKGSGKGKEKEVSRWKDKTPSSRGRSPKTQKSDFFDFTPSPTRQEPALPLSPSPVPPVRRSKGHKRRITSDDENDAEDTDVPLSELLPSKKKPKVASVGSGSDISTQPARLGSKGSDAAGPSTKPSLPTQNTRPNAPPEPGPSRPSGLSRIGPSKGFLGRAKPKMVPIGPPSLGSSKPSSLTSVAVKPVDKHRGSKVRALDGLPPLPPSTLPQRRYIGGKWVGVQVNPKKSMEQPGRKTTLPTTRPAAVSRSSDVSLSKSPVHIEATEQAHILSIVPPSGPAATGKDHFSVADTVLDGAQHGSPIPISDASLSPRANVSDLALPLPVETADAVAFLDGIGLKEPEPRIKDAAWKGEIQFCAQDMLVTIPAALVDAVLLPGTAESASLGGLTIGVIIAQSSLVFEQTVPTTVFEELIKPAFNSPTFVALVEAIEVQNRDRLQRVAAFLQDRGLISIAHLKGVNGRLRDRSVLLFSPSAPDAGFSFEVPPAFRGRQNALCVAVIKQVHPQQFKVNKGTTEPAVTQTDPARGEGTPESTFRAPLPPSDQPRWQIADRLTISSFNITEGQLAEFQSVHFCLFPDDENVNDDSRALVRFLQGTMKAKRVPSTDSKARVVFIHTSGWDSIEKLPKFQERRRDAPQVMFYTYGWNVGAAPERYHLRNVFQLGGIISFTPRAILEDPEGVERLIKDAQNDPFWDVYITPSVISLVDELAEREIEKQVGTPSDTDPLIWEYEHLRLSECGPLELLKNCKREFQTKFGHMVRGRSPPRWDAKVTTADPGAIWGAVPDNGTASGAEDWQWGPSEGDAVVEASAEQGSEELSLLLGHLGDKTEIERAVEMELVADLRAMQQNPGLDTYRRFVLVTGEKEERIVGQPVSAADEIGWDRRRESGSSNWSNASSNPASINQRPRVPQDTYVNTPVTTTGMVHRNPFQNPSPSPSLYGDSTPLHPPSAPFSGNLRPASAGSGLSISRSSSKQDLNGTVNLSVSYLPSKFSRPHSPGISYRKANKVNGLVKRGGGRDAFATGAARMPGAHDEDYDGVDPGAKSNGRLHWNRFKWILFCTNTALTLYSLGALIFSLLIWFNVWTEADIIRVGNGGELSASTVAACACLFTALLGWAGILLNNRAFLAVYTVLLWISFGLLVIPGYLTYKRRTFNLEGKVNAQWSRNLGVLGRLRIQNILGCCGYFSPFVEATHRILKKWYIIVFSLVPLHLACIVAALLCSNHVTYRFGKGMMPKAYRLNAEAMAVIMDTYASQLAEQYGDDGASEVGVGKSKSNLALIDTLNYHQPGGSRSQESSNSGHDLSPSGQVNNYGSTTGLVEDRGRERELYHPGTGGGAGYAGVPRERGRDNKRL
ncbi:hypothetical protein FRB99_000165 [Tulasnella sp. 403]|nr:hypothetical protein FRB99_000165 [Tulasnella sp. 403]